MTNIFSELKNMNHQLSNALSTIVLRRLDIFLHFETYAFENSQKAVVSGISGCQLSFLPHIYLRFRSNFRTIYDQGNMCHVNHNTLRVCGKFWSMSDLTFFQQKVNTFFWMWNFGSKFWGAIMLWSSELIKPDSEQSISSKHKMPNVSEK